jgi:hypothetical protein
MLEEAKKHKSIAKALKNFAAKTGAAKAREQKSPDHPRDLSLKRLAVDMMPWSNIKDSLFLAAGCGPLLLAQLTHTNPYEVKELLKPQVKKRFPHDFVDNRMRGTSAELMAEYLEMFDIIMLPLMLKDLVSQQLTERHVILSNAQFSENETSWMIFYQGNYYHNTDIAEATVMTRIVHRTHNDYLLFSPSWKFGLTGFDIIGS